MCICDSDSASFLSAIFSRLALFDETYLWVISVLTLLCLESWIPKLIEENGPVPDPCVMCDWSINCRIINNWVAYRVLTEHNICQKSILLVNWMHYDHYCYLSGINHTVTVLTIPKPSHFFYCSKAIDFYCLDQLSIGCQLLFLYDYFNSH